MKFLKLPPLKYLKECFHLIDTNKESYLVWRTDRPKKHFLNDRGYNTYLGKTAGKRAGYSRQHNSGNYYCTVRLLGKDWFVHRIMWKLRTGKDPGNKDIDHEDGNGLNNKAENHRLVLHQVNSRNKRQSKANTSGTLGVYWHKRLGKWQASIGVDGKSIHLGYFANKDDAIIARKTADVSHNFHKSHGRKAA